MADLPSGMVRTKAAYALIIAISQYRDPRIPTLNFTRADAEALCKLLLDPERVRFSTDHVKLLLDEQATLFNIKHAITGWLFQHATPDSTVIVYFSGHGGQESDKSGTEYKDGIAKYLLPWDANVDDLFASALSNTDFSKLVSTIKAERLVIFMDACYAAGVTPGGAKDLGIVGNPFERLAQGEGRLVIASAKPNQRSWEDESVGHGVFTYHLLEALQGKADIDHDGCVSVMEVFKYLERMVPQSVRRLKNSVQEPHLCGDISKDIILAVDATRIAELTAQRADAERRRKEEIQVKRLKLFDLKDRGDLQLDVVQEALSLSEKRLEEMTSKERELAEHLDALLQDRISSKVYLRIRMSILSEPERESGSLASDRSQSPSELKYCITCGAEIYPGNVFCIVCGHRIRE